MHHIDSNNLFSQAGLTDTGEQRSDRKLIATIEIDVGDGAAKPLYVREFEDPYLLAVNFCSRHGLNQRAVDIIERKVQETLRRYKISGELSAQKPTKARAEDSLEKPPKQQPKDTQPKATNKGLIAEETGKKLYEKGLKSLQRVEELRLKRRIEQEQEIGQEATFKPKLNPVSEKIVEMRREVGGYAKQRKSPVAKIVEEIEPCTFKPEINKVSQRIVKFKNAEKEEDRIKELYYDSVRQAEKLKEAQQKDLFSHKPALNTKQNAQISTSFMQRLDQAITKKKNAELNLERKIDSECSFAPKIGRPPKIDRNKENLPIGDYLLSHTSSKYLRESTHSVSRTSQTTSTTIRNKKSENIYSNMVEDRIADVFRLLDSDNDGLISPDSIDIENLPTGTLQFLQPLFQEIQDIEATLDEGMFHKAVLKLLDKSDTNSKGKFLSEKWSKPEPNKFPFAPELNLKSRKILLEKGHSRFSLYEESMKNKQVKAVLFQRKEAKLLNEKAKKEERQLEECSFRPTLNSKSQIYMRKIEQQRLSPSFVSK